ncbi:MAG TPA: termination factor Rho [Cellvibrionaceae bacterium]
MPIGSKAKYSQSQKRKAAHIESSYEHKGMPEKKATAIAWATVNKQSGGGERSGSGTHKPQRDKAAARRNSAQHAAASQLENQRAKAAPNSLESQTKVELLAMARLRHISGRSNMSKQELILALRRK